MCIELKMESLGSGEPLEIQITDSYSAAEKNDLAGGEVDPSQTHAYALQWRPTEKHIFIAAGGKKLCHVGLVCETVEVNGNRIAVAGIGGVLVRRECRGRGYSRLAIEAAEDFVRRMMAVKFILLFCRPAVQSLYEHLGWATVFTPVWVEQTDGKVLLPITSMAKCLGAEQWPNGEVRLASRPW
jgi:GNAT superfamily N-acetyltransferase